MTATSLDDRDDRRRRRRKPGPTTSSPTSAPAVVVVGRHSFFREKFILAALLLLLSTTRTGPLTATFCRALLLRSSLAPPSYPRPRIRSEKETSAISRPSSYATFKSRLPPTINFIQGATSRELPPSAGTSLFLSKQQLDASAEKTSESDKKPNNRKPNNDQRRKKRPQNNNDNNNSNKKYKKKRKYSRKLPPTPSEQAATDGRRKRRAAYEEMRLASLRATNGPPDVWGFDSLFPDPVVDEESVREDLYGSRAREEETRERRAEAERAREEARAATAVSAREEKAAGGNRRTTIAATADGVEGASASPSVEGDEDGGEQSPPPVDRTLTRLVKDRINGVTRSPTGSVQYSTSLLDSGRAVQFRDGVRLGKALTINIDRLCHFAKKDMRRGRLEEAQENYLEAQRMDPTDGRPYLGLSKIAERRGDLKHARGLLKEGIGKSSGGYVVVRGPSEKKKRRRGNGGGSRKAERRNDDDDEPPAIGHIPDLGANPFLLQALGTLEQRLGNLATAEGLYLRAIRSRPSHAAAWVSLAQLRTKRLRQGADAGRACYESAERELRRIGAKPSSFVYTAWASMEYKKGGREDDSRSLRRARDLYRKALDVDPRCSVAFLGLGVMESECGNYDEAQEWFEEALAFDQRNSRVLQAYAIMESRRAPRVEEVDSRRVLDLFERALKANPRDAGVYQAYALFVVELGDVDSARELLRRGTSVNKRHAPVWQAWGVLETRYSTAKIARDVFQQGIWACAAAGGGQSGGRRCARLWQAWGVLEAREGDHAAARRCFSRALDADQRNVAALTAWTLMEAELGNFADARSIFERSLRMFRGQSVDKTAIWRAYEVMEERAGNTREAQRVFQRSMGEAMEDRGEEITPENPSTEAEDMLTASKLKSSKKREVEFSRWDTGSDELDAEVWMNNGSIEGKVPAGMMNKLNNRR